MPKNKTPAVVDRMTQPLQPGDLVRNPRPFAELLSATDTPVTDIYTHAAVISKRTGQHPNKLTLSAADFTDLAANAEVKGYLPGHQQEPATVSQLQTILGVTRIEISETARNPILTYDPSTTELLGNAAATSAPVNGFEHSPDLLAGHAPAAPSASQLEPSNQAELRAILDTQAKAYAKAHDMSYAEAVGTVFGEVSADLLAGEPSETTAPFSGCIDPGNAVEASPLPPNDKPTLSQNFSQLDVLHGVVWDMMDQLASQIGALRVVLMEQESEPGSVAKAIHPGTLATVAANLLSEHNALCDDMEMLARQIRKRVFEKSESLPESVWLELVDELSKERDMLSKEDMGKISSIATNLLCFAHSSPEVGAALGNLVEFSRRHGAFLYRHERTSTMTWQWLQGRNPALRKNASRPPH